MKKRIFGAEFEFGTMPLEFIEKRGIPDRESYRLVFLHAPMSRAMRQFVEENNRVDSFLLNEARFYFDTNFHPEYSTPETASPRDLVRWEKAGERIVEGIAEKINADEETARQYQSVGGIAFLKNNTDPEGWASWGCHQNYLTSRKVELTEIAEALVPFLLSAPIWNGSGKVLYTPHRHGPIFSYVLSQRMHFMKHCLGPATTSERSMINTRDQTHANRDKWRRLEIICNDSHMSEVVSYLDYSLIGLMLEMLESGFLNPRTCRYNLPFEANVSYRSLRGGINSDLTLKQVFRVGGRWLRALDIQWMYFEVMKRYERYEGITPEQKDTLKRFESLLGAVKGAAFGEEPEKALMSICDWAAKLAILKNDALLHRYAFDDPADKNIEFVKSGRARHSTVRNRILFLDLAFHDTRRRHGLHYSLERKGLREKLLSEEEIVSAILAPPSNTRAAWRRYWQDKANAINSWNWDHVSIQKAGCEEGSEIIPFYLENDDPFANNPESGKIIPNSYSL